MDVLTSLKNIRVKTWRGLLTKKGRAQTDTYLIEGEHLIEDAAKENELVEVMVEENRPIPDFIKNKNLPITFITTEISKSISATETPQGIFAVCRKRSAQINLLTHKRLLLIDGVQDPGNIGTMIRTADAAGIDGVILGEGSADLYNPKVIRSAQGSHFHLPIVRGQLIDWMNQLKEANIPVYGTALENAVTYEKVRPSESFALIVGNEGSGVRSELLEKTDKNLYIPIYGKSESLNVAIATGILLYHLRKDI